MKIKPAILFLSIVSLCLSCHHKKVLTPFEAEHITHIETGNTTPYELVNYACSLCGTPYQYNSTDPKKGLDCSGFVTCVFDHFHMMVPRTSVDFTPVQTSIPLDSARLGDLVLFTGSDSTKKIVGHMGIISSLPGEPLQFLHAASDGVTETAFHTPYFEKRYLKTIRIFPSK